MSEPPPYNQPGYPPQQGQPPAYQDQKGPPGQVPPGAYPAQPYPNQPPGYPPQQPGAYPPQQPGAYPPQQPGGYPAQPGYAPPPAGYAPPSAQMGAMHTTTTVIAQPAPVVVTNMTFGEVPVSMTCPRCSAQIVTSTIYQDGTFVWLVAAVLCFIGCWPCCLVPFCIDGCKDVSHNCPNCRSHLGSYRRM